MKLKREKNEIKQNIIYYKERDDKRSETHNYIIYTYIKSALEYICTFEVVMANGS